MKKLAIVTTHPIQYNDPLFTLLAQRGVIDIKVFYTWGKSVLKEKYDPGFKQNISWDIEMLKAYNYTFVKNVAKHPGSHHFRGIDNPTLIKEINDWNTDAVLVYGWALKSHLKCIRYFHKKKLVLFRGDSTILDKKRWIIDIIKKVILIQVFKKIDIALYVGAANQKYFLYYKVDPKKLVFAPHAIDNERFAKKCETGVRKQMNVGDEEILFLYAGKLENKKNPFLLLNAFINSKVSKAHLLLVGNGNLEQPLKQYVQGLEYDYQQKIHFLNFQNQTSMPGIYQACDVFVLPSQGPGETWGLSVNEAMACSKPIVVSDKCGCVESLVRNGCNGYIFKSCDVEDLTEIIKKLSANKAFLNSMGRQSSKIIADWNYEKVCGTIEEIVKKV